MKEFISKWSNWWILAPKRKQLDDAFEKELNELIEREVALRKHDVVWRSELLGTVAYEPCVLVARKEQVYTADGKFMFSVSMTERAKQLLDNEGWEKGKESWLDYRKRTEKERELEQQKQYKFAADLAECFNKANGNY